jgi:transposase
VRKRVATRVPGVTSRCLSLPLVIDTFEKRDKETVVQRLSQLPYKEAIEAAVIDMSRTFRSAIREVLPDLTIVIDKFHVVGVVIDALDKVRKREKRSKAKGRKRSIYNLRQKTPQRP